jgi:hypothetical protein
MTQSVKQAEGFDPLRHVMLAQSSKPRELSSVDLRTLTPFQRALLVLDGTVTKFTHTPERNTGRTRRRWCSAGIDFIRRSYRTISKGQPIPLINEKLPRTLAKRPVSDQGTGPESPAP